MTNNGLRFDVGPQEKNGARLVEVWRSDEYFQDFINVAKSSQRLKFFSTVAARFNLDANELFKQYDEFLLRLANETDERQERLLQQQQQQACADSFDESRQALSQMDKRVIAEAQALLQSPDLISQIKQDIETIGVAGEEALALTLYLCGTSRLLEQPLAVLVQGPSSSGKSYIIEKVASLFPKEATVNATTMSTTALYYMPPGSLRHKFVVAGERSRRQDDDQAEVTRALRELLSAGELTRLVTVTRQGEAPQTEAVYQKGPIAYVESTTLNTNQIFDEDLNRMILVTTNESAAQTKQVLKKLAERFSCQSGDAANIRERHFALQRLLEPLRVRVPFADALIDLLPTNRIEIRRGAGQLLAMTAAVALLHQRQRDIRGGVVQATVEDYGVAYELLSEPLGRMLGRRVSASAVRLLEQLAEKFGSEAYTLPEARRAFQFSRSALHGWHGELVETGLVERVSENQGTKAAVYRVRVSIEEARQQVNVLPPPAELAESARTRGG
ncbi:MAG: hypothetical protein KatS3mg110_4101 [Pirellulaceae bacterium]|nr:MAG: hypothetical protein KatS3mg110_4101 [Pirellulaceae bacterium]